MDFAYSPRMQSLQHAVTQFMDSYVLPAMSDWTREVASGNPHPALLEDLKQAQHHIHMHYFIWSNDPFTQEVKEVLLKQPPGKVVVLPPTETAKVIMDINGVEHKFIDKFHLYYLDLPGYYYGLTGDSDNKFEFFLLLRALYYQQDWWINIARDLPIQLNDPGSELTLVYVDDVVERFIQLMDGADAALDLTEEGAPAAPLAACDRR